MWGSGKVFEWSRLARAWSSSLEQLFSIQSKISWIECSILGTKYYLGLKYPTYKTSPHKLFQTFFWCFRPQRNMFLKSLPKKFVSKQSHSLNGWKKLKRNRLAMRKKMMKMKTLRWALNKCSLPTCIGSSDLKMHVRLKGFLDPVLCCSFYNNKKPQMCKCYCNWIYSCRWCTPRQPVYLKLKRWRLQTTRRMTLILMLFKMNQPSFQLLCISCQKCNLYAQAIIAINIVLYFLNSNVCYHDWYL